MADNITEELAETEKRVAKHIHDLNHARWVTVKAPDYDTIYSGNSLRFFVRDGELYSCDYVNGKKEARKPPGMKTHRVKDLLLDGFVIEVHPGVVFFDEFFAARSALYSISSSLSSRGIYMTRGASLNIMRVVSFMRGLAMCGYQDQADWIVASLHHYIMYTCPDRHLDLGPHGKVRECKTLLAGEDDFNFRFQTYRAVSSSDFDKAFAEFCSGLSEEDAATDRWLLRDKFMQQNRIVGKIDDCTDLRSWTSNGYIYYQQSIHGGIIDHFHLYDSKLKDKLDSLLTQDLVFGDIYATHT